MRTKTRILGWKPALVAIVALLMLAGGFLPAFPPLFETKEARAQGGASISGTVTNASDEPVENVEVQAYVWDSEWDGWNYAGNDYTAPDGTYEITGLEPGHYIVEFVPPDDSYYLDRYYDDQSMGYLGEPGTNAFELAESEHITGIDAVLEEGGRISGQVTSASEQDGVDYVDIYVYAADGSYIADDESTGWGNNGFFETDAVPAGQYKLWIDPPWDSEYVSQWYDRKADFSSADTVTVIVGQTTEGTDVILQEGGRISGTVTNASDEPVENVQVRAIPLDWYDDYSDYYTYTASDGTYTISGLPAGQYRVRFDPPYGSAYVWEYFENTRERSSATPVEVQLEELQENIDAVLEEGGRISGRVTNASDEPVENVQVRAYVWDSEWDDWNSAGNDYTASDGTYEITGLEPGHYIVEFIPPYDSYYLRRYYDDQSTGYLGEPGTNAFELGESEHMTGIDAVLEMGGKISGRVTSASEPDGVDDVEVVVYDLEFNDVCFTYTDWGNNGYYETFTLPAGQYKVQFQPQMGEYVIEWFNNQRSFEDADPVTVNAGETITGIDAFLEVGGKIKGRVTSASEPDGVDNVYVGVYDLNWNYVRGTWTGEGNEGNYEVVGLQPGQYKVFFDPEGSSGYISEWYDNRHSFEDAVPVTVNVGETITGIDAFLEKPGSISGRVTSASQPGGVSEVEVALFPADDPEHQVADAWTAWSNGTYSISNIPPGDYKVLFTPQYWSGDYEREWYDDKRSFDDADVITIGDGQNLTGINAVLERNGYISGRVTGELDPDGLYGVQVMAYDLDHNYCGSGWSDSEGRYYIYGLDQGSYKIYFAPYYNPAYGSQWYDGKPDFDAADPVEVFMEQETSRIDAHLVTGSISGTVTSPEELEGVSRVDVYAYDTNGDYRGSAVTDENGGYTINNLPSGDYFLYVYPWWPNANDGRSYAFEWYEDKGAIEEAIPVSVTAGSETGGIDFSLESGSISGAVTGWDGPALGGVDVYVHDGYFHLVGSTATGEDGSYTVKGIRPGDYKVYFDPTWIRENQGRDYTGEYHLDKLSFYEADTVTVASDVTGVNAVLEAGSYISGTVTSGGSPAEGVFVHAYKAGDSSYWVSYAETASDGIYRIGGLPPGDYKLSFNHASGQNYLDEWYNDAPDFPSATTVSVAKGGGATGIDADLATGGSVSGRVTGSDAPGGLEGVQVRVLDGDYGFIGGTLTGADGSYAVGGLATGTYYVEFFTGEAWSEDALNYRGEFYNDEREWEDADPVSVTAGADTPLGEAELQRYATISGRVTGSGHPGGMEGVWVELFDASGWYKDSAQTDASGNYVIDRVEGGDYKVLFGTEGFNYENGTDYASEWHNDKVSQSSANILTVTWGEDRAGVDAVLQRNGRITGRVTSASSPQGVENANVYIYDLDENLLRWIDTESDGYYSVAVTPGNYKVCCSTWYTSNWYDNKSSFEEADPLAVAEGQTVTGIDFYFPGSGSISGRVTSDAFPDGVEWSDVYLYRADNPTWYWSWMETDSEGRYSFQDVPAGEYKVLFEYYRDGGTVYKWYDDRGGFEAANVVTVTEGMETQNVDAHFSNEVSISGRVTGAADPGGIYDTYVRVYDSSHTYMGYTWTDGDGYYSIRGLAPGDYRVSFNESWWGSGGYLEEWYDNKRDFESADPVTVAEGAPATGIDAMLDPGGSISGKVTGDGASGGLPDVEVVVYDENWNAYGYDYTASDGTYEVRGLPTGQYRVAFYPESGEYIGEWFDDKPDFWSADPVTVTEGEPTTGVDAHLAKYASISGQAKSAAEPDGVPGLHVYLYEAGDPDHWLDYRVTDSGGRYSFGQLRAGDYKVAFSPISGMDYAEEWFDGAPDFASAEVISLSSGEARTDIDAFMDPGGSISGRVTSGSMPGGIEGVGVTAYTTDGKYARACNTEADGTYYLGGLATGEYLVRFDPGRMPYKGEWYDNRFDEATATPVPVTAGSETTGIDAVLSDSGSISGRVTSDAQPDGVGDVYVHAYPMSDEWNWSGYAVTRGDGTYVIENLLPGQYKVIFNSSSGQNYKSLWYDGAGSFQEAQPVVVNERVNTGHIDGHLSEFGSISGRVTDGTGGGIPDVLVRFFEEGTGEIASVLTDSEGNYELYHLNEGTYRVKFEPPFASPFKAEWYDDKPDQASSTPVELSPGEKKTGVDAVLSAEGAPQVLWVNPDTGMDTQSLDNVFIYGSGFTQDGYSLPRVLLMREGQTGNEARDVTLIDSNSLTCDLNLIGEAAGPWDVVVVNPNGQGGRMEDGFTVVHKPQPPTLEGPPAAFKGDVGLHGTAEAYSTIKLYRRLQGDAEWTHVGDVETNQYGNWSGAVNCPVEGVFEFQATATNGGVTSDPSDILTVVIGGEDLAVLTDHYAELHGSRYDPDPDTGIVYLSTFSGAEIKVKMRFSSAPDTISFQFKGATYPVTGPDASGWYTATISGWTWSQGTQRGKVLYRDNGSDFEQTLLEVVLIDPSGYVYDLGTGQRVQGAKATLQYWFEGAWQDWPADEYEQANPQYTDAEGKYGWDVHPGKYRVLVEKATYRNATSDEVTVPPEVTDLNIGLLRNAPSITSISPSSGKAGDRVTIAGTCFGAVQAGSKVTFAGGKNAAIVSWSDTSITCSVPAGAVSGDVVVVTAGGTSNGMRFTIQTPQPPAPAITSINPASGKIGDTVVIAGENFGATQGTSSVIFAGDRKANIVSWSDTSITCNVPAGAVSGDVVVVTAGGTSNGVRFTVEEEFKPAQGTTWYLAEGYTGGDFDTWVLVQNPGSEDARVTLSFQLPPGKSAPDKEIVLPAARASLSTWTSWKAFPTPTSPPRSPRTSRWWRSARCTSTTTARKEGTTPSG
ncbi:MAG: hypothetical protein HPY75_13650 [Actinobacteria bacterium]|nr:hypothetical protein [Actinomycetota bacterium]